MGFDPTEYVVGETDGEVTLFVVILEGFLQRMVTVEFETLPGTATQSGMYHMQKENPKYSIATLTAYQNFKPL